MISLEKLTRLTEEHKDLSGLTPMDRLFASRDFLNVLQLKGTTMLTAILSICSACFAFSLTMILIRCQKNRRRENESVPLIEVRNQIELYGP